MDLIQKPGGLVLPSSMAMKETEAAAGFSKGEIIPLKGLWLRVLAVQVRQDGYFQLALAPISATKGALKRATGKKGVRHEAPKSRYRGRPIHRTSKRRAAKVGSECTTAS